MGLSVAICSGRYSIGGNLVQCVVFGLRAGTGPKIKTDDAGKADCHQTADQDFEHVAIGKGWPKRQYKSHSDHGKDEGNGDSRSGVKFAYVHVHPAPVSR